VKRAVADPKAPPCSDAAVKARTGRDWRQWCTLLDKKNALTLPHPDIVKIVSALHNGGGWWSQAVTVGYERLRGKRVRFGRNDGTFSANASKTVPVARDRVQELIAAGHQRRRWAPAGLKAASTTSSRVFRFTDANGRRVDIYLQPKDDGRTIVAVEVSKLPRADDVAAVKAVWKQSLQKLCDVASIS
jgi:hypothetical protein